MILLDKAVDLLSEMEIIYYRRKQLHDEELMLKDELDKFWKEYNAQLGNQTSD